MRSLVFLSNVQFVSSSLTGRPEVLSKALCIFDVKPIGHMHVEDYRHALQSGNFRTDVFLFIILFVMQAVADVIRTTLGPRSMLKMLLDASGGTSLMQAVNAHPQQEFRVILYGIGHCSTAFNVFSHFVVLDEAFTDVFRSFGRNCTHQ